MPSASYSIRAEDLHFCYPWHTWLTWDGQRWLRDSSGQVQARAKQTVARMYADAARALTEPERKAIASWAMRSEAEARIQAMMTLAPWRRARRCCPTPWTRTPGRSTC